MSAHHQSILLKHAIIFTILILSAFFLFIPLPYYQSWDVVCKPGQLNCPQQGLHLQQPLIITLLRLISYSSSSNTSNSENQTPKTSPAPTVSPTPSPTVSPGKKPPKWTCPQNGYIDCMPIVEPGRRWQCESAYIDWVRTNCASFQGITY